jgi:hypothetical protein
MTAATAEVAKSGTIEAKYRMVVALSVDLVDIVGFGVFKNGKALHSLFYISIPKQPSSTPYRNK